MALHATSILNFVAPGGVIPIAKALVAAGVCGPFAKAERRVARLCHQTLQADVQVAAFALPVITEIRQWQSREACSGVARATDRF